MAEEGCYSFKQENSDEIHITISFKNISQIPISTFKLESSEQNLFGDLKEVLSIKKACIVTDFSEVFAPIESGRVDCIEKRLIIKPQYGCDMPILSFKTETENIYGMKTIQVFNVIIINLDGKKKMSGYRTKGII